MPKILAGFLAVLLVALPLSAKLPSHPESIKPLWSEDRAVCTTWSVNKLKGLWMTAAHCVVSFNENNIWVQPEDLYILKQEATIVKLDLDNDLAMLQANVHEDGFKLGAYPHVGDEVTVYGFPMGWTDPIASWLRVSNTYMKPPVMGTRSWMFFEGPVLPGHSGSPILDTHGRVISVFQKFIVNPSMHSFSGFILGPSWDTLQHFVGDKWEH